MLNYTSAKILLCVTPTDMRKSFDGLAALAREHLKSDPLSGTWFVFRNKRADKLKLLYWDKDGYVIWQKRLEAGTFEMPQIAADAAGVSISSSDLALILSGIDLSSVRRRKRFELERQAG
ncbi:IS66 family insertion sequence element accessory protein TnpB [Telmatocola sphagniphila]|uniref:IS66 family insertion sequence element accessory protein TnpB n=1 Tax=Telmatocola sphagniphila TaxID=1123043 RepID=A0A8E6B8H7_9BACT|nr:IS66 family insertion sequence element accessory protein TnpB [Telmatocola sphagniphila]QVL33838.1 IS66 family insertion sequence element accessory protein TnpB [Telmatocola sphagniphila]